MRFRLFILATLFTLLLSACGGTAAEPQVITEVVEVTRVVEQVQTVVETVIETVTETIRETVEVEVVALPPVDPLAVSGAIVTAGSSTVFPLTERMAERFQDEEGFSGNITIDSIGSGAGLERFCVAKRARPISPTPAGRSANRSGNLAGPSAASRLSSASAQMPWPSSSTQPTTL
jgi:phosphate transport system substrate-binding protein